jgi:hypothetical protein
VNCRSVSANKSGFFARYDALASGFRVDYFNREDSESILNPARVHFWTLNSAIVLYQLRGMMSSVSVGNIESKGNVQQY